MGENGTVEGLERGYSGTAKTISTMWKLVQKGKLDPSLQKIATWIVLHSGVDARTSSRKLAEAIFTWVRDNGLFIRDPFQIEKIETPEEAMKAISEAKAAGSYSGNKVFAGDCDTYSIMTNAIAGILGFQTAFETTKNDSDRPDEFSHVYSALLIPGEGWVAFDASTPGVSPGWRPPSHGMKRWHESEIEKEIGGKKWLSETVEEIKSMAGMNGLGYGYAGGPYWGTGEPEYLETPENKPLIQPPNPGELVWMVPKQPANHKASTGDFINPDHDWLYNPDSELMRDDRSLAERSEDIMTIPSDLPYSYPFYQKPDPGVSVQTPFPPGWPWSYQVEQLPGQQQLIAETDNPSQVATTEDALPQDGMEGIILDKDITLPASPISTGMGQEYYDRKSGQSIDTSLFTPQEIADAVQWGDFIPYDPAQEEVAALKGEDTSLTPYVDQWTPEPSGGYSGGPIGGSSQDDEDHDNLLNDLSDAFSNLTAQIPSLATEWGSSYLKQKELKIARDIANARSNEEKERSRQSFYESRRDTHTESGAPDWLLPVAIGGGALLVGGLFLYNK